MGVYERGFEQSESSMSEMKGSLGAVSAGSDSRWASPQAQVILTIVSLAATAVIFRNLPSYAVDPFVDSYSAIRTLELLIFWVGWPAICFGPAVIAAGSRLGWRIPDWSALAIGVGWVGIIALLQVTLYLEYGQWFINYLQNNPVLYISDILAPAALVVAHYRLRPEAGRD